MNTYKNILADKFVRETNYVIIHDTDNLDELEEQWDAFDNIMTSRQRKISDERSTAIWNMSNKQHYEYLKEQIILNMSKNMDDDITLSEDSSIYQTYDNDSEEIEKFEADSNLHIVGDIEGSTNIEKLKNLEKQYNDFATMVNDNKKVSDEESRRIYGMTNTERYNKLRAVLLAKCLEDEEKAKTIKPVDNNHLYITDQVSNEGFVGECYREKIIREKAELGKRHKHVLNDLPYFTPQEMIDMGVHKRDNFYSDEPDSEGLTDNITTPLWFASYQDMCMNHVFEDYRKEWISKLLELYSDYEQIKESGDNKRILARKQSILDLGWNPEIPFTSENRIKASKRVNNIIENTIPKDIFINLDNIYDPGEDYIEEEATAQTHSPVLLVFTKGKTPVISDGIKFVTKSEYSHVSISFDPKLQEVFSYNINPKYNGFLRENLSTFGDNVISVFAFFIDKLKAKSLKDKILDFESNKTTFDMRIFVNKVLHIDRKVSANEYKQVCSTFVDHILKSGGVNLVGNQQLPAPGDLYNGAKTLPNKIIEVFDGIASTYKGSVVKRKLDHLLRNSTPAINESVNNYYRVTCSGYGIYNVLKKNIYDINKDSSEWIKFKNSKACSWLPLPPSYCENNQSYFTELGYRKFMKETYPIICKYIDKKSIDVEQRSLNEKCIVYRDQYQVVIDESINEVAKVNDKGEQVPETCPKCGSKVGVFFRGEPVFVCTNKECEEYFGVVPCRKHKNESSGIYYDNEYNSEEDEYMLESINDMNSLERSDSYYNIEKWESGKTNSIWITGLSGSGKSTIAKEIADKYNAEYVELDNIQRAKMGNWDITGSELLDDYIKSKRGLNGIFTYVNDLDKVSWKDIVSNEKCSDQFNDLFEYIFNYVHTHKNKKFVIEGVQIAYCANKDNAIRISNCPVIIKNPSENGVFKAEIRREKRLVKNGIENKDRFFGIMSKVIRNHIRWIKNGFYMDDLKYVKDFKSFMDENFLIEAQLPKGLTLRNATKNDTDNMIKWELESVDSNLHNDPKVIKLIEDDVKVSISNTKMIMYDDKTIGMLTTDRLSPGSEYWYIGEIYIVKEYRGKGIGTTLIKNEITKHNKIKLQVSQSNKSAQKLYKSLGFKITETNDKNKMYVMTLDKNDLNEHFILNENSIESSDVYYNSNNIPEEDNDMLFENLNDIKNGVNPYSKTRLYHVSFDDDLDGKTLTPRIPTWIKNRLKEDPKKFKQDMEALKRSDEEYDNFSYGYEEYKTPRVCFSNSINGAINSIVGETSKLRLHEQTLYVYVPEKPVSEYKVKTNKQINKDGDVFDSRATNETWILEPVKLKFYGTIVVDKVTRQPFDVKFSNDTHKTIAKYTFEWHWFYKQTKSVNEKIRDKKKNGTVNEHFILNEVKRFPVEFDDNGNLTIYKCRMGNIAYGDEIAESVRLLESYRNTSNIEGMKYEISKIWFLIQSLEKKIQKKKTSDEEKQIYNRHRTTAINVFKTNLEYIMKIDSEFNFTVYYNNTPFSDNGIRISSGTLKFALSGLKSLIMR